MKIYKDFHNLSFLRHILQKFHFDFKFYCASTNTGPVLLCKTEKTSPALRSNDGEVFLYSGIGSRIRSVNQPSAQ